MSSNQPEKEPVQKGAKVKIHYTLNVEGNVVDSSEGKTPLEYQHGSGQLIPGVEKQLEGLTEGEKKQFEVAPKDGYGEQNPNAVQNIPKTSFQNVEELKVGGIVSGQQGGRSFQAKILEVGDSTVKLDFNHPLAGKNLTFSVEVVSVEPATAG